MYPVIFKNPMQYWYTIITKRYAVYAVAKLLPVQMFDCCIKIVK